MWQFLVCDIIHHFLNTSKVLLFSAATLTVLNTSLALLAKAFSVSAPAVYNSHLTVDPVNGPYVKDGTV